MKKHLFSIVLLAVLSTTGCSRLRSVENASAASTGEPVPTSAVSADRVRDDLEKLQGTWRIEASIWNGVRQSDADKQLRIIFQANKLIVVDKDDQHREETIKLMPDRRPKAIDYWSKGGGQASPGIYALEGDTFTWCSASGSNKVRPTSFSSEPGSKQTVLVLRREKS
jgi:uncharacterized protein (TIGR03067 family)